MIYKHFEYLIHGSSEPMLQHTNSTSKMTHIHMVNTIRGCWDNRSLNEKSPVFIDINKNMFCVNGALLKVVIVLKSGDLRRYTS